MTVGTLVTKTADAAILTSGKPIRLYGASILSGGGGGGIVIFRNGTSTSGDAIFQATGTTSIAVLVANIPAVGIPFPAGLFVDVDNNVAAVNVVVEQQTSI